MTDPRDARNRRQLSDDAMWRIVCSPQAPTATLAVELGVSAERIRNARMRHRRQGWSCRVAYVPCAACAGTVTVGGHVRRDRAYHDGCRPAAKQALNQASSRRRWDRMDVHTRNQRWDRAEAHQREHQGASLPRARAHRQVWTAEEEAFLIEHPDLPLFRLAEALGRTVYATKQRRHLLKQRGLL